MKINTVAKEDEELQQAHLLHIGWRLDCPCFLKFGKMREAVRKIGLKIW